MRVAKKVSDKQVVNVMYAPVENLAQILPKGFDPSPKPAKAGSMKKAA